MIYIFDTNSLASLKHIYPARFPTFWQDFEGLVRAGEVLSVREVYRELEVWDINPHIRIWMADHKGIFLPPTQEETDFVSEIFKVPSFRALVDQQKILRGGPVANPFLIASAKINSGCVVTEESQREKIIRIPNVCKHFGVSCCNFEGFLESNGWEY